MHEKHRVRVVSGGHLWNSHIYIDDKEIVAKSIHISMKGGYVDRVFIEIANAELEYIDESALVITKAGDN